MIFFILFLFPIAANNMNLYFATFFSKSKYAGEITIFYNVLAVFSYVIYFIVNWSNDEDFYANETVGNDVAAHFLSLIP